MKTIAATLLLLAGMASQAAQPSNPNAAPAADQAEVIRQALDRAYAQMEESNPPAVILQAPEIPSAPAPAAAPTKSVPVRGLRTNATVAAPAPPVPGTPVPPPPAPEPAKVPVVAPPQAAVPTAAAAPTNQSAPAVSAATVSSNPPSRAVTLNPVMNNPAVRAAIASRSNAVSQALPANTTAAPPMPPIPGAPKPDPATAASGTNGAAVVTGLRTGANGEKMSKKPEEDIIAAGEIRFQDSDMAQVLEIYQELTGRTVLRPASLPAAKISIRTQTPLTRKEAIQALDSIMALNGITMVPQGEKFVKALATGEAPQAGMVFYDADPSELPEAGQYVAYIAKMKYVDPTEIATALQPFASKAPNSIMAIKSTQTLVLRDYAENIKRMLDLIKQLDVYVPNEYNPVVIPIKYALASDIAQVLGSLTEGGGGVTSVGQQRSQSSRFGIGGSSSGQGGANLPGYRPQGGSSSGYGGYGGSGRAYPQSTSTQPRGTFASRLNTIVNKAASGPGEIVVLGETKIIADERTNSLLVFASAEDIETIKDIISKLDVVLAQVLIEAVVLEVSLTDTFSFGVSALQHPGSAGKWQGVGGYKNEQIPVDPWSWISGGSGGTNGGAILPNLPSGFSYFANYNDDLSVAIQAIAAVGDVKVLSRPRVQTSHAVPCRIFVGETRPYVTGYGGGYGGYSQSQISQLRIGIELNVLPLINPDGLVVMDIDQRVDNVGETVKIDNNDVPTTVERSANAKVSVRDGETIILGGFIRSENRKSNSGVPFFKDIPVLGYLFRSTSKSSQRVELMILIRPRVLPTPEDAAIVANEEKSKLPGISSAERELGEDSRKLQAKSAKELYKREGF